jgi:hypothetical protein
MDLSIKPEAIAPVAISQPGLVKRFKMVLVVSEIMVLLARKYHAAGTAIPRSELVVWPRSRGSVYRKGGFTLAPLPIQVLIATSPDLVHYFANATPTNNHDGDHLCTITDASVLDPIVRAETISRKMAWAKVTKYPSPKRTAPINTQDACANA